MEQYKGILGEETSASEGGTKREAKLLDPTLI
jgi:hypothetical protein